MPRDYRVYLDDILEATAKISDYTAGLTRYADSKFSRAGDELEGTSTGRR